MKQMCFAHKTANGNSIELKFPIPDVLTIEEQYELADIITETLYPLQEFLTTKKWYYEY